MAARVIAIISPDSASAKRLREEARQDHRLVDATQGRKTRSILIMDSNHIILSSQQVRTLAEKLGLAAPESAAEEEF